MRFHGAFFDHINSLEKDIYVQPDSPGHIAWATDAINNLLPADVHTTLDVGCGSGFCSQYLPGYTGITLGKDDYESAISKGRNVLLMDMTNIDLGKHSFDLIFARHVLEHSPFPVVSLMEWHRIAKTYLILIAPAPDYWGWGGQNHYSVANQKQLWWWLRRAGWKVIKQEILTTADKVFVDTYRPEIKDRTGIEHPGAPQDVEYRYLCKKVEPVIT